MKVTLVLSWAFSLYATIKMTQTGLIAKIVKECGLDSESKRHNTPAVTKLLHKDSSGPQREHQWSYHTIIGMLTYLSMTSRTDIAFAVHQCARFMSYAHSRNCCPSHL
jgi:hypothetical protein